jgi:predicted dehydrogenase/threonine dehydrogenase-like Zn-dependent dehydrogenase
MKQILQDPRRGLIEIADVPSPAAAAHGLLIRTTASMISAGTERMQVQFGSAGLLGKARQQPEKVKQVLEKVHTDGLFAAVDAVRSRLDQPVELGYCNVGVVLERGAKVAGFAVGDRVVSNGRHAEVVAVPSNLCARIPANVSDKHAAFTVLGAIGLQGTRLVRPSLGECVAVTGLGLIGLLCVQILRAHGCRVLGIDSDPSRVSLAKRFGASTVDLSKGEDPVSAASAFSGGRGLDAVLIAASTQSSVPVREAAQMCRKRGRIVLVGVTGLELSRADFYEKELTFQVSCSYGPGRYDRSYEEGGQDYPIGFVRWTAQRNFDAVLNLIASGALDLDSLTSHTFPFHRAGEAYELLSSSSPSLGILLEYPQTTERSEPQLIARSVQLPSAPTAPAPSIGFLGAGNYAGRVLIPAFARAGAQLNTIISSGGVSAWHHGRKHGFARASTDAKQVVDDPEIHAVVVATRHDSHARFVVSSLIAGKHVFVEKPLCLTLQELGDIEHALAAHPQLCLMVGFNRRFAPQVVRMKELIATVAGPKAIVITVNAGAIPPEHWTQSPEIGGGRVLGEACHFVDLLRYLSGTPIVRHSIVGMRSDSMARTPIDTATFTLEFENGSIGTVHYLANGHKGLAKERVEVFCGGRVLQLDNYRSLKGWGWKGFSRMGAWRQDKGAQQCVDTFVAAVRDGLPSPIPRSEIIEVSRASIELSEALAQHGAVVPQSPSGTQ